MSKNDQEEMKKASVNGFNELENEGNGPNDVSDSSDSSDSNDFSDDDDEVIGKKVVDTVRYEDAEDEEEKETISLFVSARNKQELQSAKDEDSKSAEPQINEKSTRSVAQKKPIKPLVLVVVGLFSLIFVVVVLLFLSVLFESGNEAIIYEETPDAAEVTVMEEQSTEVVLDREYYHEFSGMTIYYPSDWELIERESNYIEIKNSKTTSFIALYGVLVNKLEVYKGGNATYQDMAVNLMAIDVQNLNDVMGTVENYTDSIQLGDRMAYIIAEFTINYSDVNFVFHSEKKLMYDFYISARMHAPKDNFVESAAVYQAIVSNIVLPSN